MVLTRILKCKFVYLLNIPNVGFYVVECAIVILKTLLRFWLYENGVWGFLVREQFVWGYVEFNV